jgi:FkbM family methyltransferase
MSIISRLRTIYQVAAKGLPKPAATFRPYVINIKGAQVDFKFLVTDEESKVWYDNGNQLEGLEIRMLLQHVKPDFHILEIGVHNGFYTALFTSLLHAQEGKYIGIEMMPACYAAILAQMKLNEAGPHFKILNAAAGNENTITTYADVASGNGSVQANRQGIQIPMIKADELLEALDNRIDLLKVDVEGFEAFVLQGAAALLAQTPHLQLEIHNNLLGNYGNSVQEVLDMIDWNLYDSFYFCNPNSNRISKQKIANEWLSFDPHNPPLTDNFNLFLVAKGKQNSFRE